MPNKPKIAHLSIPIELVERRIYIIRGQKVILDTDLADLYGVTTKALNQAVKRNLKRFPGDFMFRLSNKEQLDINRWSQIVTSSQKPRRKNGFATDNTL